MQKKVAFATDGYVLMVVDFQLWAFQFHPLSRLEGIIATKIGGR